MGVLDLAAAVNLRYRLRGAGVVLSWDSAASPETVFQIYLDDRLIHAGRKTFHWIPRPARVVRVTVGGVRPRDAWVDFSASLPSRSIPAASIN